MGKSRTHIAVTSLAMLTFFGFAGSAHASGPVTNTTQQTETRHDKARPPASDNKAVAKQETVKAKVKRRYIMM